MRLLGVIILVWLSACGPEPKSVSHEIHYLITPQKNGFKVEIRKEGYQPIKYFTQSADEQNSQIRTNHTNLYAGFFQISGDKLFHCVGDADLVRDTTLTWNMPEDWKIANSFGTGSKTQNLQVSCHNLNQSIFAGGRALTLIPTSFGMLSVSPSYPVSKIQDLIKRIEKKMQDVEAFWGDSPEPYFLVLINYGNEKKGGTAHLHAFQLQLSGNEAGNKLDHLIAHEYFHRWNGLTIRPAPYERESDKFDIWWFIEGFTDYFARMKFAKGIRLHDDELKNQPLWVLKSSAETPWELPYKQGRELASRFDAEIKDLSHFMRDLLKRARANPEFYITQQSFLQVMCEGQYMNCGRAHDLINRYVILGEQF